VQSAGEVTYTVRLVTPCGHVGRYRRFGVTYCLIFRAEVGSMLTKLVLKLRTGLKSLRTMLSGGAVTSSPVTE
jgi:hypothetical protein